MENIIIRKMCASDIATLMEVEQKSFTIPWSRKSFEDELENDIAIYFAAKDGERTVGYIGMWEVCGEGDITNVAVHPEYRKRGIGSRLIKAIIKEAKKRSLSLLTLEVRESNAPAIHLYSSYGFSSVGMRKSYYSDNKENAIIMTAAVGS